MEQDIKPDGNQIEVKIEHKPDGNNIDLTSESKLLRWWDNYWYHYKWHTIIVGFFVFLALFLGFGQVKSPKADTVVTYCGPFAFTSAETEALRDALGRIMPKDFDENGDKYTEIVRYQVYSEQEMEAEKELLGETGTINLSYNAKQLSDFNSFMSFGESSIYFLSEYMYGYVKANKSGVLKPLSDVLGEVPAGAYDEYAVRLKDTAYYQFEPALRVFPEDTLVCMTAPYQMGSSSDADTYANSIAMFRAIVTGK